MIVAEPICPACGRPVGTDAVARPHGSFHPACWAEILHPSSRRPSFRSAPPVRLPRTPPREVPPYPPPEPPWFAVPHFPGCEATADGRCRTWLGARGCVNGRRVLPAPKELRLTRRPKGLVYHMQTARGITHEVTPAELVELIFGPLVACVVVPTAGEGAADA
jgi:hypothetical protein